MSPEQLEQWSAAVQRSTDLLVSAAHKVIAHNPTWEGLPALLTKDELAVYVAFVRSSKEEAA